jgi:hypothetical protein
MIWKRKSRISFAVTIWLDARKVTVTVNVTVLDRERGRRNVAIRHAFRRSTTTMGERICPKSVLRKTATQPISPHEWFPPRTWNRAAVTLWQEADEVVQGCRTQSVRWRTYWRASSVRDGDDDATIAGGWTLHTSNQTDLSHARKRSSRISRQLR